MGLLAHWRSFDITPDGIESHGSFSMDLKFDEPRNSNRFRSIFCCGMMGFRAAISSWLQERCYIMGEIAQASLKRRNLWRVKETPGSGSQRRVYQEVEDVIADSVSTKWLSKKFHIVR